MLGKYDYKLTLMKLSGHYGNMPLNSSFDLINQFAEERSRIRGKDSTANPSLKQLSKEYDTKHGDKDRLKY